MGRALRPGEEVEWNTPQGVTQGHVPRKLTRDTPIKGRKAAASGHSPEYRVESPRGAKRAAHKKTALKKR